MSASSLIERIRARRFERRLRLGRGCIKERLGECRGRGWIFLDSGSFRKTGHIFAFVLHQKRINERIVLTQIESVSNYIRRKLLLGEYSKLQIESVDST